MSYTNLCRIRVFSSLGLRQYVCLPCLVLNLVLSRSCLWWFWTQDKDKTITRLWTKPTNHKTHKIRHDRKVRAAVNGVWKLKLKGVGATCLVWNAPTWKFGTGGSRFPCGDIKVLSHILKGIRRNENSFLHEPIGINYDENDIFFTNQRSVSIWRDLREWCVEIWESIALFSSLRRTLGSGSDCQSVHHLTCWLVNVCQCLSLFC